MGCGSSGDFMNEMYSQDTVWQPQARRTSHITIIPVISHHCVTLISSTLTNYWQDTNVMISYLPLIDSLTRLLSACPDLSMSILIPGIVMSELDGLRKSAGRTCQIQAQDANRWAASELQKRAVVRGQRDYATTAPGGSWRRHYYATGKVIIFWLYHGARFSVSIIHRKTQTDTSLTVYSSSSCNLRKAGGLS